MLTISAGVVSDAGNLDDPSNREGWSMDDFVSRLESGWLDWDELTASERAVAEGREPFVKHGTHDQSTHGNWARHGGTIEWDSSATPAKGEHKKTFGFTEIGQVVTPLADALFPRSGQKGGNLSYRSASEVKRFVARAIADRMDASGHLTEDDWSEYIGSVPNLYLREAWNGTANPDNTVILPDNGAPLFIEDKSTLSTPASRRAEAGSPEARSLVKEYLVSHTVAAWATSSTHDEVSVGMQNAVQSAFGLTDAWKVPSYDNSESYGSGPKRKWLTECARAQYEFTQETLKDAGIDSLVVFRGTRNLSGNVPVSWSASEVPARRTMESGIKVRTSPLSSWSVYESDAQQFAIGSPGGVISRMVVPRERIFSTPLTGFGCLDENEIVVLGGEYTVDAFNATSGSASHGPVVVKFAPGLRPVLKHGHHDQSSHGNWAHGSEIEQHIVDTVNERAGRGQVLDSSVVGEDGYGFLYKGERHETHHINPDGAARIINAQGWDEPAQSVDQKTFDRLSKRDDLVVVYRGGPNGLEKGMTEGTPYIGDGAMGPGTYVTSDIDRASAFASRYTSRAEVAAGSPSGFYLGSVVPMLMPRSMFDAAPDAEYNIKSDPLKDHALGGSGAVVGARGTDRVVWNTSALVVGPKVPVPGAKKKKKDPKYLGEWGLDVVTKAVDEDVLEWAYYKVVGGKAVPLAIAGPVVKHGTHDQSSHGNWAHGPNVEWDRNATIDGRTITKRADRVLEDKSGLHDSGDAKRRVASDLARRVDQHMNDLDWVDAIRSLPDDQKQSELLQAWNGLGNPDDRVHRADSGQLEVTKVPSEDSPQVGTDGARALIKEYLVSETVRAWASSSRDNPMSVMMQKATQSAFGLQDAWSVDAFERLVPKKFHIELARAQYDATQELLSSAGIEAVRLWRGTTNRSGAIAVPFGPFDDYAGPPVAARSKLSPLSSWSTAGDVAANFAGGYGIISRMDVPRERIFSTAYSGSGCMNEAEFIVLGGEYDILAGSYDADWSASNVVAKVASDLRPMSKHGTHDQSSHGNWAHGSTVEWDRAATANGRTVTPSVVGKLKSSTGLDEASDAKAHVAEVIARRMSEHMSDADWQDYIDSQYQSDPSSHSTTHAAWHGIPRKALGANGTENNVILTEKGNLLLKDDHYLISEYDRTAKAGSAEAKELVKQYLVSTTVDSWARSSTQTLNSVLLQRAVQSSFGLDDAKPVDPFEDKSPRKFHVEMARAMYEETQDSLRKAGVDAVELWRGTTNRSRFIPVPWERTQSLGAPYGGPPVAVRSQLSPLSSWSSAKHVARDFADFVGGYGVISRMVVPRERIFATPWSGVGCMAEDEFVVLGGEYDIMAGGKDSSWEAV